MKNKSIKLKARRKVQRYVDFTKILNRHNCGYPMEIFDDYMCY